LPAFFALFGVVAAIFLLGFRTADLDEDEDDLDDDHHAGLAVDYGGDETFVDDDEYLEYEVRWDDLEPVIQAEPVVPADDSVTAPMPTRVDHPLPAPAEAWHSAPVESWRHLPADDEPEEPEPESWRGIFDQLLVDDVPPAKPRSEPIGFAHNGFHVDEERFQPLAPPAPRPRPSRHERSSRHYLPENQPPKRPFWFESNGRHSRDDPDDAPRYGRHSTPGHD
jgi:hypothetical protein